MRKLLIPLLLAGALMPAAASAERVDRDRPSASKSDSRAERQSKPDRPARVERAERPARAERADRPVRAEKVERAARPERVERVDRAERPATIERTEGVNGQNDGDRRIERRVRRPVIQTEPVTQVRTVEPVQQSQTYRPKPGGFVDALRQSVVNHDRDGDRDRDRDRWRDRDGHRWSGDWRRDHRYDWHSYRNRYSSLFRLGRYYDPYRYNYRRFSIGFTLWPSYYSSNFWLNDPWQYRLPPAYGPYRWVRYYDDALLVNIYTGEVVDVVYNFFW